MRRRNETAIILRRLSSSDLGWFAEPRDSGAVASKQRAININAGIIQELLLPEEIDSGGVLLYAQCIHPGCNDSRKRILSKVGKNWRLGGPKVPGKVFADVADGDFFVCRIALDGSPPFPCEWTVVMAASSAAEHAALGRLYDGQLVDRMALLSTIPPNDGVIANLFPTPAPASAPIDALGARPGRKLTVSERLKQPHIMQEMMRTALSLSTKAQQDFLVMLERVGTSLRDMLLSEGMIQTVEIDHAALWSEVAGIPIAFVDGGMANIGSLGAEPIAVRVGSYVVVPGQSDSERESFRVEKQLVDELFETNPGTGIFDDAFDDVGKLRDAARISLEAAGALTTLEHPLRPHHLFVHGSLVNPVSPYALDGFPNFTTSGIERLLPTGEQGRTGRDCNFVSVYLRQLQLLRDAQAIVCGVVERASHSSMVTTALLELLKDRDSSPGASVLEEFHHRAQEYRLSDAVLFHSILNEGEFLSPVEINRNDLRRAPDQWKNLVALYPRPVVTYVGMGEMATPLRCEFFVEPEDGIELSIRLIVHSCRLMPQYAFPVGLDIVDKFAKVPNWMARPINSSLAVQVLKRAMESGNPAILAAAKRLICGTTRDWMFRPNIER